jgi:hypothetical protein
MPSSTTLPFRSTWHERCNCIQILAIVHLYRILQLDVFVGCPFTRTPSRLVDAEIHGFMPHITTLSVRSSLHECGNCIPILAIVNVYRILQLGVFVRRPFTSGTPGRLVDAGMQSLIRDQQGN